ncbi:hypothetical protein F511_14771 [Dorcoceras hygrometricum]|uniref:Uncharacterized protein n=1 Tax=Dorcoceras hygrometricum TaxID=472368 RepID=A0A2Z7DEK7_9LAMI|nr:hypothetical protein F511_14771 [Dorcoceras hygrometricum]
MLTSALLIPASSNRYADVITTDTSSCAPANFDFFQTAMLTSSLLLVATSSRHADVIIAESRFLFASNPSADFSISFNQQC